VGGDRAVHAEEPARRGGTYATNGSTPTIRGCLYNVCNYGIWSVDALSTIDVNTVQNCQNNGILTLALQCHGG